jgi:hypothetical protein
LIGVINIKYCTHQQALIHIGISSSNETGCFKSDARIYTKDARNTLQNYCKAWYLNELDPLGAFSYTFGYRRTDEIFKTPPFIYSIFFKTIPIRDDPG